VARLLSMGATSLDGYIADEQGRFDWSVPSPDVHAFVNERAREIGTELLGRRMYEVMRVWDDLVDDPGISQVEREFAAIWAGHDKVVYSPTLERVTTARTRLEQSFDAESVRAMKAASDRDLSIAGPTLAAHAAGAGLIDEFQLYVNPVVVGGGTRFLPSGVHLDLELLEEHRFENGVVFLRYRNVIR
jgi:dihydrofolate reductase